MGESAYQIGLWRAFQCVDEIVRRTGDCTFEVADQPGAMRRSELPRHDAAYPVVIGWVELEKVHPLT